MTRDIRPDLRERLEEERSNRERAIEKRRKAEAEEKEAVDNISRLMGLLEREAARFGEMAPAGDARKPDSVGDFFIQLMREAPHSKEELRIAAEKAGYFKGPENPKRVTHLTITNMERGGRIKRDANDRYTEAPRGAAH